MVGSSIVMLFFAGVQRMWLEEWDLFWSNSPKHFREFPWNMDFGLWMFFFEVSPGRFQEICCGIWEYPGILPKWSFLDRDLVLGFGMVLVKLKHGLVQLGLFVKRT